MNGGVVRIFFDGIQEDPLLHSDLLILSTLPCILITIGDLWNSKYLQDLDTRAEFILSMFEAHCI